MSRERHVQSPRADELTSDLGGPSHHPARPQLSRRRLLGATVAATGGAGALLLAAAGRTTSADDAHQSVASANATPSWLLWEPAELSEPEARQSVSGVLDTRLRVAYAYHDIGGYRLHMRGYENGFPGPTLRARPGDVLQIELINDLPPNVDPPPAAHDLPHHFNTTNLHSHGLHVSPDGIADNVFRSMEPGKSYAIEIVIPDDHPGGTFWYHPHRHGSADVQVTSGMVGALIIDGDVDQVPEIAAARERILILSEVLFDHMGAIERYDTVWPEAVPRFLAVNGQREPIIHMRPGEVQRWRIVQAAHESTLNLALSGHNLHLIAHDGIALDSIDTIDQIVVAPGQRVELLVQAGEPGDYELAAIAHDQGYPSPTGPLARVIVAGGPATMSLPASLPPAPLATIEDDELTGSRTLTFSVIEPEFPPAADYQEFAFLVDDRRFDHDRVDQQVTLGPVEEWTVINEDATDHVFHIHTNPFQVTQVNDEPLAPPVWRDTVTVPRFGSVTFRSRFLDFTGRLVLHCHMFNHEELGMMQVVEIVPPAR